MPFQLAVNWADATIAFSNIVMAAAAIYAAMTWKNQLIYRDLTEERKLLFIIWKQLNDTALVYQQNLDTISFPECKSKLAREIESFREHQKAFNIKKRELSLESDERFSSSISKGYDSIPKGNVHQFALQLEEARLKSCKEREKAMQHIYSI